MARRLPSPAQIPASGVTAPRSYLELWQAKKRSLLSCPVFAPCRTRSSARDMSCFRLCIRDMVCSSELLLTQALLSPASSPIQCRSISALSGLFDRLCDTMACSDFPTPFIALDLTIFSAHHRPPSFFGKKSGNLNWPPLVRGASPRYLARLSQLDSKRGDFSARIDRQGA